MYPLKNAYNYAPLTLAEQILTLVRQELNLVDAVVSGALERSEKQEKALIWFDTHPAR